MEKTSKVFKYLGTRETPLMDFLQECLPNYSKRAIKQTLDSHQVAVNGNKVWLANWKLKPKDTVTVANATESTSRTILTFPKDFILEETDNLIVFNKPAHVASEGSSKSSFNIHEAYLRYKKDANPSKTLYPCHRLDKETTGVLVCAKNKSSCESVMDAFRKRKVKKTYLAICENIPEKTTWTVECHLSSLDPKTHSVKKVTSGGQWSKTDFKCIGVNKKKNLSLIEASPLTGRSHQIRYHLILSNLFILGDKKYKKSPDSQRRHMLHALRLEFLNTPEKTYEAAMHEDFLKLMKEFT